MLIKHLHVITKQLGVKFIEGSFLTFFFFRKNEGISLEEN